MDKCFELGEGTSPWVQIRAFQAGVLDVPFAPAASMPARSSPPGTTTARCGYAAACPLPPNSRPGTGTDHERAKASGTFPSDGYRRHRHLKGHAVPRFEPATFRTMRRRYHHEDRRPYLLQEPPVSHDDQRAIKAGAKSDISAYLGDP